MKVEREVVYFHPAKPNFLNNYTTPIAMGKKFLFLCCVSVLVSLGTAAQKTNKKTTATTQAQAIDSFAYYDELFNELEAFLDSILQPRSFAILNVGISNGFFTYQSRSASLESRKQFVYAPAAGYYHKYGLGIHVGTSVLKEGGHFNLYQATATASYDYMQNRSYITGVSYTRFFTKDSLAFYTSPLSNELYAYFSYRKGWLRPAIAASYGWGSRTSVEERKEKIKLLRGKPLNSSTTIETTESVSDFTVTASVKHDFYWLNVVSEKDYIRVTPQLALMGGTQKFGLNQTNTYNVLNSKSGTYLFNSTENIDLSEGSRFQPLALSARIRSEFSKGKFFIQPQLMLDYYFPAKEKNLSAAFAINTGVML